MAATEATFGRFKATAIRQTAAFTFHLVENTSTVTGYQRPKFHLAHGVASQSIEAHTILKVNQKAGTAEGTFAAAVLADQPFFRWYFLELAFFLMMPSRGLLGVHGAALVKNGRGILLRAQSGGGKTTLSYACARNKFQALAEDVVWLDLRQHVWWGMPWSFHLLPDAKRLFPELSAYTPVLQTNGELKLEVNLETIRAGSTITSATPGPIILLERLVGGSSQLEPLDLITAKSLWLTGVAGNETDFPDYETHIERLLHRNAYRLYFGDDIEAAVDLLEPLFDVSPFSK